MKHLVVCLAVVSAICMGTSLLSAAGPLWGEYQRFAVVRALVNGAEVSTDVPPVSFYGRTMVPVRFVADGLGAQVAWDVATQTVNIARQASGATSEALSPQQALAGVPTVGPNWQPSDEELMAALIYGYSLADLEPTGQYPDLVEFGSKVNLGTPATILDEVLRPYMAIPDPSSPDFATMYTKTADALFDGYYYGALKDRIPDERDLERLQVHFSGLPPWHDDAYVEVYFELDGEEFDEASVEGYINQRGMYYDALGLHYSFLQGGEEVDIEERHFDYLDHQVVQTGLIREYGMRSWWDLRTTGLSEDVLDLDQPLVLRIFSDRGAEWLFEWDNLGNLR